MDRNLDHRLVPEIDMDEWQVTFFEDELKIERVTFNKHKSAAGAHGPAAAPPWQQGAE